jgi:hypothetical protein
MSLRIPIQIADESLYTIPHNMISVLLVFKILVQCIKIMGIPEVFQSHSKLFHIMGQVCYTDLSTNSQNMNQHNNIYI